MAAYLNVLGATAQDRDFKSLYRFNSAQVDWINDHFLQDSEDFRGGKINNLTRMMVFLRFVGDPGFQIGIAEDLGISQSSVCRIVSEVAGKIMEKSEDWIKFPMIAEENDSEKALWQLKNRFPSCIGAIDCTHVRISKPKQHSGEYVNRKGKRILRDFYKV